MLGSSEMPSERLAMGNADDGNKGEGATGKPCVSVTRRYSTGKHGLAVCLTWSLYSFLNLRARE